MTVRTASATVAVIAGLTGCGPVDPGANASERRRMADELHALEVAFDLDLIDAGDFER